jgi:hypothetical protein
MNFEKVSELPQYIEKENEDVKKIIPFAVEPEVITDNIIICPATYYIEIPPGSLGPNGETKFKTFIRDQIYSFIGKCKLRFYIMDINEDLDDIEYPLLPITGINKYTMKLTLKTKFFYLKENQIVELKIIVKNDKIYGNSLYILCELKDKYQEISKNVDKTQILIKVNNKQLIITENSNYKVRINKIKNSDGLDKILTEGSFEYE